MLFAIEQFKLQQDVKSKLKWQFWMKICFTKNTGSFCVLCICVFKATIVPGQHLQSIHPSIHFLWLTVCTPGLTKDVQTFLSPASSFCSSGKTSRCSQAWAISHEPYLGSVLGATHRWARPKIWHPSVIPEPPWLAYLCVAALIWAPP